MSHVLIIHSILICLGSLSLKMETWNNDEFTSFRFAVLDLKGLWAYLEHSGHTLRGLFVINDKRILRKMTMNDLSVGESCNEI